MTGARHDLPVGTSYLELKPGEYGKDSRGVWIICTPDGRLGSLAKHSVTEHEDGTITVSPSILVTHGHGDGIGQWHGFLERGVWRSC